MILTAHAVINISVEGLYTYLPIHSEGELIANLRERLEELNKYKFSDTEWERFFTSVIANPSAGRPIFKSEQIASKLSRMLTMHC